MLWNTHNQYPTPNSHKLNIHTKTQLHNRPKNVHHLPCWRGVIEGVAAVAAWEFLTEGKGVTDRHVGVRHLGEGSAEIH